VLPKSFKKVFTVEAEGTSERSMMGQQDQQKALFSYNVDLDRRVRADNPLRRVAAVIDFTFARQRVAHTYGNNGNVSVDPAVILKMIFLLFYDNVASERQLMKIIAERLDYLWFLGYGLDQEIPDHSILSKARARWGNEVFEQLFVQTISACVHRHAVALFVAVFNFCRVHKSLNGKTPAMAAHLTDHKWSVSELLSAKS
jgi:transposase